LGIFHSFLLSVVLIARFVLFLSGVAWFYYFPMHYASNVYFSGMVVSLSLELSDRECIVAAHRSRGIWSSSTQGGE
jgi:hypothetical protein